MGVSFPNFQVEVLLDQHTMAAGAGRQITLTHLIETIRTCGKFGRLGGPATVMVHEHAGHSLGGIVLGVGVSGASPEIDKQMGAQTSL